MEFIDREWSIWTPTHQWPILDHKCLCDKHSDWEYIGNQFTGQTKDQVPEDEQIWYDVTVDVDK